MIIRDQVRALAQGGGGGAATRPARHVYTPPPGTGIDAPHGNSVAVTVHHHWNHAWSATLVDLLPLDLDCLTLTLDLIDTLDALINGTRFT